ncbi:uncharacterized protein C8Q71DRAFT_68297 [Rhodofomes roseus]|uniref:Uncharacterized protein n=1 Tax=Rhodofomes roseus TaxID=34475 RepID=A0ABQ8KFT1_9APHY|nr:uncharacterized protein C8Q71DRAFT_68297 [Rhodofomes roseus]KAH9836146.1 hypothetical protein C8Q71DRAFT_68297 [Rhodofomes roseus]
MRKIPDVQRCNRVLDLVQGWATLRTLTQRGEQMTGMVYGHHIREETFAEWFSSARAHRLRDSYIRDEPRPHHMHAEINWKVDDNVGSRTISPRPRRSRRRSPSLASPFPTLHCPPSLDRIGLYSTSSTRRHDAKRRSPLILHPKRSVLTLHPSHLPDGNGRSRLRRTGWSLSRRATCCYPRGYGARVWDETYHALRVSSDVIAVAKRLLLTIVKIVSKSIGTMTCGLPLLKFPRIMRGLAPSHDVARLRPVDLSRAPIEEIVAYNRFHCSVVQHLINMPSVSRRYPSLRLAGVEAK